MEQKALNPAQVVLLKAFMDASSQQEADELTQVICEHYGQRLEAELIRLAENGTLAQEQLDELRTQHLRTPYRQ